MNDVSAEVADAVVCCSTMNAESQRECSFCGTPICSSCLTLIKTHTACEKCSTQIQSELEDEKAGLLSMPTAVAGGMIGAAIGGIAWALVVIFANMEVGYVAIGVGWLAGTGVVMGAGGKKGASLQMVAAACSVFGLLIGKYFSIAHAVIQSLEEEVSYFSLELFMFITQNVGEIFTGSDLIFDLLWIFFAISVAWRLPKQTEL